MVHLKRQPSLDSSKGGKNSLCENGSGIAKRFKKKRLVEETTTTINSRLANQSKAKSGLVWAYLALFVGFKKLFFWGG